MNSLRAARSRAAGTVPSGLPTPSGSAGGPSALPVRYVLAGDGTQVEVGGGFLEQGH